MTGVGTCPIHVSNSVKLSGQANQWELKKQNARWAKVRSESLEPGTLEGLGLGRDFGSHVHFETTMQASNSSILEPQKCSSADCRSRGTGTE